MTIGHSDDASQDTIRLYLSGLRYERVRQQTNATISTSGRERLFLPERKRTADLQQELNFRSKQCTPNDQMTQAHTEIIQRFYGFILDVGGLFCRFLFAFVRSECVEIQRTVGFLSVHCSFKSAHEMTV